MDVQECICDIFVSGQKSSVFKFLKKGTDTKLLRTRERQKQSRWKISLFLNSLLLSQESEEARKAREGEKSSLSGGCGQPLQLVHEKIDENVNFGSN